MKLDFLTPLASLLAVTMTLAQTPAALAAPATDLTSLRGLYEGRRYSQVVDSGEKTLAGLKRADPDWLAVKVLISAASAKCQPLYNSANLAKEAYDAAPTNIIALDNYAGLQLLVGDKELAGKLFQKATNLAADDFFSHVGLSEVYSLDPKMGPVQALAELKRAEAAPGLGGMTATEKWLLIGDHYLALREAKLALAAYMKAESALSGVTDVGGRVNGSIYRAALSCDRIDLALKRRDSALAAEAINPEVFVLTARKLCSPGKAEGDDGKALSRLVYEKALRANGGDSEFFYRLGRAFGASGQTQYARLALEKALVNNAGDGKYVVAYAAELARSKDYVKARRQLAELAKRYRLDEPTPQRSLAQGLARAGLSMLGEFDSDWASTARKAVVGARGPAYKTAYATLLEIKCHCRFLSMQYTMRAQPGVIFAYIPDDTTPVAFLIYDSKTNSPAGVWAKIKNEAKPVPLAKSEDMRDFPQLVQVALDYSEAPYRPLKPYYTYNPLPLRILKDGAPTPGSKP